MKLTEWFFDELPARHGVYQVLTINRRNQQMYSYWDGEWWGPLGDSPAEAAYSARFKMKFRAPLIWWRGLAEKP